MKQRDYLNLPKRLPSSRILPRLEILSIARLLVTQRVLSLKIMSVTLQLYLAGILM